MLAQFSIKLISPDNFCLPASVPDDAVDEQKPAALKVPPLSAAQQDADEQQLSTITTSRKDDFIRGSIAATMGTTTASHPVFVAPASKRPRSKRNHRTPKRFLDGTN